MAFPVCFLLFMVPFPFVQELGFSLQGVSVESSAWLLRQFGMSVMVVGRELHVNDLVFTIGLPCSGINTLVALLALAAVYTHLLTGPLAKRAVLFVLAFPIAVAANILRVASIVLIANFADVDVATGVYHDISSPLFFILAFGFLVLIGRVLKCKLSFEVPKAT
jgi:exosortase